MADYKVDVDVNVNDGKLDELESRIKSIQDKTVKVNVKADTKEISNAVSTATKTMQSSGKTIKIKPVVDTSAFSAINKTVTTLNKDNTITVKTTGIETGLDGVKRLRTEVRTLDSEGKQLDFKVSVQDDELLKTKTDAQTLIEELKQIDTIKMKVDTGDISNQVDKIESDFRKITNVTKETQSAMDDFKSAQSLLNEARTSGNNKELISGMEQYEIALKKVKNQIDINTRAQKEQASASKLMSDKQTFSLQMTKWLKDNSAAAEDFGGKIQKLQAELQSCDSVRFSNIKSEFKQLTMQADISGKTGLTFADKFKQQFSKLSSYVSAASVIMTGIQIAKSAFQNVLDIDTQMTELKRVTDLSASQYTNIYDSLTASAQKYGTQLTDLISATADWSRAGFDADTASGLAEITSVYQHIADLDYDTSAENLLTAYKGFQSELTSVYGDSQQGVLDAVSHISDVYNEIDNNYATTAADIGEAVKRSASALSVAGNSLEEVAGMATGITEVTQDPEKAGNALKVISMRLRGMSGSLEELGEDVDDNVTNISKMQGQILNLTNGKVNIFDDAGNFKSTYEILQDVAKIWKDLSSTDQADLLETMAGKHRANELAAVLNNWERVEAATKSASNSTGSAMKEQEKYADSLQGRLNSLKAMWQQLSNMFINSDIAKGAITGFKDLLSIIEKIMSAIGGVGTAGLLGSIVLGFKYFGKVKNLFSGFSDIWSMIDGFKDLGTAAKLSGESIVKAFSTSPKAILTGIGLIIAAVSTAIQFAEDKIAEVNKARQEKIDTSNNFNDSFNSFEQAYIKYSDKTILSADEESELTSAINGTISALGDKSAALRDVAGASSDYVSNLNDIAKAELKQQKQLSTDAQKAAKDTIKSSWSEGLKKGLADKLNGVGKYDFLLPSKSSKEWKAIKDITESKSFKKYIDGVSAHRNALGLDDDFSKKFNFDADTNLDGYIEQLNYANEIVDKLNAKAQETNDDSYLDSTVYKQASSAVESLSADLGEYIKQTYSAEKASYQLKNGIPKTTDEFYKMQEAVLKASSSTVTGRQEILDLLNKDYADTFDLSSTQAQLKQFQSLTNGIKSINKDKENKFEALIDLKTKINNGDCSVGDYTKAVDEANDAINEIAKKDYNTANALRVQLGIEVDSKGNVDDEVVKLKNKFVKALTKNNVEKEVAESFTNKLSKTELEAAVELSATGEIDLKNIDTKNLDASIKQKIQDYAKYLEATRFTLNIETETEDLSNLNTALSESRAATGLTQESIENIEKRYKSLDGYNPAAIFEKTTTGVRLNTKALQSLEEQYVATNKAANDQKLGALAKRYKDIEALREKEKSGSDKYKDYSRQLEDLNSEIEAAKMAAAAYDGLTSSYNEWLNAKSNGQAGDMYDEILDGAKSVKELAKAGKWGNTELQSYIEMFSAPDSLDNATPEQYAAAWGNAISKSNRYFKEGTAGIDAFISDVAAANSNLVKMNDQGVWEIQPNFDVKDWAKAAGVAESTVESIFGQMEEYGFDVPIGIEEESIDDLVAKADSASSALKSSMGQDFDIKVNTDVSSTKEASSEIENLKKQRDDINNSSATVEVKEQGVEAVNSAIEAVINKQIELEQPTYMQLDTSQVKSTMTDALTALQNYQNAVDNVKSLEMQQDAGIEIDTSQLDDAKKKVDETAEAIAKLDGKQKVAIGLEASDSVEDVKKKIENGKVKLTVDTDVNKSATQELASNLEKIKDKDVTVTVKVKGLDDVKTLNKQINIAAKVDGTVKDLTAFADGAKKLQGVGDASVDIEANLKGDIDDSTVDNLSKFAKGAKSLQDVEDVSVNVTANLESTGVSNNVFGDNSALDNINRFARAAERLKGVEDVKVNVSASLDSSGVGNDIFGNNSVLDNMSKFAKGANALKDVGNVKASVTASLSGDGIGNDIFGNNSTIDNLKKFAAGAKSLADVGSVSVKVSANLDGNIGNGVLGGNSTLDNLGAFAKGAKQLKGVEDKSVTISAYLEGNLGLSSDVINNLPSFVSTAKALQSVEDKSVTVSAYVGGDITSDKVSTLSKFGSVISSLPPSKTVTVNTNVDTGAIANVKSTLQGLSDSGLMHNYTATITVNTNVDTSAVDNYSPADKTGKVTYEVDASKVNSWSAPPKTGTVTYNPSVTALTDGQLHKTGTITYKATVEGAPVVNGTAHANGTAGHAFKNGDWSTKDSGTALMGELGQELIVRDGRFFTVGDNGAEFVPYKKGDIIFNHKQTEELFKNGYVTSGGGRGVAMASGTAFANVGHGTWKPGGIGGGYSGGGSSSSGSRSSSNSGSNSNSNSNANKEAEKTEETLDWIETALDRVERAISRLDKTATSTYKNWTKRGTALNDQISQTRREIDLQNQAYNRYIQQANSVGLDAGYAAKVRDGTIDIEKITDEDLNNKIQDYQNWYNKALDCLDAIDDLRESESKLYEQRFENVSTKYDGYLGVIQHEKDMLDEFVSQTETAGYITSGKYYDAMSANAKKQQEELKKQRDEMISELNNAVNSGTIEKYSESWYSMLNAVDEVTKSIEECNTSLLEYEKNLRELDWQIFDLIQDKISKVADESEFLIKLMSNKKLYEDNGQLTDEGMATMGQYGVKYNVYMAQANKYSKKIKELQADLAKDPYNQDIANQLQEYIEAQQEAILNAEDMKNSIKDMVSEGIDKELSSLQKLIDKRNDALDAAKD